MAIASLAEVLPLLRVQLPLIAALLPVPAVSVVASLPTAVLVPAAAALLLVTAPPSPILSVLLLGTALPSPILLPTRRLPKLVGLLLLMAVAGSGLWR